MATFIRLTEFKSSEEKEKEFFNSQNRFIVNEQEDFTKIPGNPIAYWVSDSIINIFSKQSFLGNTTITREGLITGNNNLFLRFWSEVNFLKIGFSYSDSSEAILNKKKWIPITTGGENKKWFGNNFEVINWDNDGNEILNYKDEKTGRIRSHNYNGDFAFKEGFTWTAISGNDTSFRLSEKGFLFDSKGSKGFLEKTQDLYYNIGLLNTKLSNSFLKILSPTIGFKPGYILKIPYIYSSNNNNKINDIVKENIDITREEWDSRETSWNFKKSEFLRHKPTNSIEDAYNTYCTYWKEQFFELHSNEEELNRIFIDIYDLAEELTPDVPLEDITILKDESNIKDGELIFKKETLVKQFISYAVGCMFGRYSPDKEGLILANQGETIDDFREKVPDASFMPDDDNIIPILEDEYFPDDIVSRFKEFLKVTFGAETLAENLEFIAGALSKSKKGSESPENVIRDYFLKSFFKDHVKMYKKRPIYWLFTSGKGRGFNALVYMHRYDRETLAKMRTDYLLKLEDKLDARMGMLGDSAGDKQERGKLNKQIEELAKYDEVLNNKALEFIDIDLDDGVVVNYAKFEGLVGKI